MKASAVLIVSIFVLTIGCIVLASDDSDACTGFYVGADVSESGNVMIGQTADGYPYSPACYVYQEAVSNVSGRTIEGLGGFVYPLPATTYGYSSSDVLIPGHGAACFGSGSINDQGVAFTGSITTFANKSALGADPLVENGLGEDTAARIVAACASSAKEGVDLIASIIDEYGSSENNIYLFADKDEAWYMEVYTGHQYCAMKLLKDKVAVFGNENTIVHLSDVDTVYVTSERLTTLPVEYGFAVFDDGELDLLRTYSTPFNDYCHMRTWIGHRLLAPSTYSDDYDPDTVYEHLFVPDHKVSVKDLMDLCRDRFDGTDYCLDEVYQNVRVIGSESTSEAHILVVDPSLPDDMCITRWSCIGPAEYGVFFPVSNLVSDFYGPFAEMDNTYTLENDTAYAVFKMLNIVCTEESYSDASSTASKDLVSEGVKDYWSSLEQYYIDIWPQVVMKAKSLHSDSPDKARAYLNSYSYGVEKDIYAEAKAVLDGTVLGIGSVVKCNEGREAFTPFVDVAIYGKRYGWSSSIDGNTMTLTREGEKVILSLDDPDIMVKGKLRYGELEQNVEMHIVGDSFRVNIKDISMLEELGSPVVVDYPQKTDDRNDSVFVVCIILIVVAVAAGAYVFMRR